MRKNRRRLQASRIATVLAVCALAACDQRPSPPPSLVKTSPQVGPELVEAFSHFEQQLSLLQSRIASLEQGEQAAIIGTEENLYALAKTRHGTFVISAKDVTPYLDGFKVSLHIGNLTSANFKGAEISVAWGSAHKKQYKVTNDFAPGSFTQVELALTPATSEDVKRLVIGISVNDLVLSIR
jgi:Protein of unknown function (DUF3251)